MAIRVMDRRRADCARRGRAGRLGAGSGRAFDMEIRVGAGAYVCGEETSLLNRLEGKRGVVRAKPPLPALEGFMGKPTVVNNVISLASVPVILDKGAAFYKDFGLGRSRGTIPLQIAGNVKHGGLYEIAFGLTLGEIVDDIGGGTASGPPGQGGAGGRAAWAPISRARCSTRPSAMRNSPGKDGLIGHAGLTVFDDSADMLKHGPLRDGVLRHRILRQMHPLPHRRGARRRNHRPHRRGRCRRDPAADRPVQHDESRLALRAGRLHPLSGDVAR